MFRYLFALLCFLLLPSPASAQWREVRGTPNVFFNEVFFIDPQCGWVTEMGATVLRTSDGGLTWAGSPLPNATGSANRDICFISRLVGFVGGSDGLWNTVDGGVSWRQISIAGRAGGQSSFWFIDAQTGVFAEGSGATGIATFFRTSNGGATWNVTRDTSTALDAAIGGMTYMNGKFYASGGGGNLWRSDDNGATWFRSNTGSAGWQEDLVSYASKLYIASADGSSSGSTGGGKVLANTSSDLTWNTLAFPSTVMWGITMYSPSNGWAAGETGKAYRTTDSWATWTDRSCGIDPNAHIDDIWFADETSGWAVGQARPRNGNAYGVIYKYVSDYARAIPDTINFGQIQVGTTSPDRIAKIQSVGSGLTLTRAIAGTDLLQFGATGGLGGSQSPGYCGEASTPLHFKPTSIGRKTAYLEYTYSNGTPGPRVVLVGEGVKPNLGAPALHHFDTLQCAPQLLDTIMISNDGSYPLIISTATMQTSDNGTFQVVSPVIPAIIPQNTSRQFVIRAIANGPGPVTGTMLLGSNDVERTPWQITFNAFYRQVAVGFNRDSLLIIPPTPINETASITIDYRNIGNGTQTIESVVPVGQAQGDFFQVPSVAGRQVRPGESVSIGFQIAPLDTGWFEQRFRVRTQPCSRDTFITVRVYGVNPIIGSVRQKFLTDLCGESVVDTIQVSNSGNVALVVQQPTIDGADSVFFKLTSPTNWPQTIPPGESIPLTVNYSPAGVGAHNATLRIQNNDRLPGKKDWVVALSGIRESVRMRSRERTRDLKEICLGSAVDVSMLFTNEGTAPVSWRSAVVVDPSSAVRLASATASTDPIVSGSFVPVNFHLETVALGGFALRVAVGYGPCDFADTILLTGTVVNTALSLDQNLDLGELPVGIESRRTVSITNNGNIAATLRSIRLHTADPAIRLDFPALPQELPAGTSLPVDLVITPLSPKAGITNRLIVDGVGLCADSLTEPLRFDAIVADIVAERGSIQFNPLLPCLAGAESRDSLLLRNYAAAVATISNVRLTVGGASGFSIAGTVPTTIPASGTSLIELLFRPVGSGLYRDTLVVETVVSGASRLIRVPLAARSESLDLRTTNAAGENITAMVYESLSTCEPSRRDSIVLRNAGTIADTVSVVSNDPGYVVWTAMPVIIPAGDSAVVGLTAVMSGRAGDRLAELKISAGTCPRESVIPVRIHEIELAASLSDIDYQTVNVGRSIELDAKLVNSGTTDRVIDRLLLSDPSAPFTLIEDFAGRTIAAGESLTVPVRYLPTLQGSASVRLLAILRTPCMDTVSALVEGVGVVSSVFVGRREIDFGSRLVCDNGCEQITIEGTGDAPVTISNVRITDLSNPQSWHVSPSAFPMTILPGESRTIQVCFDSVSAGTSLSGTIVIESDDAAQPSIRIPVSGAVTDGLLADSVIRFVTDPLTGGDTTFTIGNGSGVAIDIDRLELPPGFSLLDPLPLTVPAGGERRVRLAYRPQAGASSGAGRLVVGYSLPCPDSLVFRLDAGGTGVLTTGAPELRGRWGERIRVPISLDNPRTLSVGPLEMEVAADPQLLHPLSVTPSAPWLAAGWRVEARGLDQSSGAYRFDLLPPLQGASVAPSGEAAIIEYEVLRGDAISTPITPAIGAVGSGVSTESVAGSFILEDYCDAYGRLLRTGGAFRLSQNFPNPFSSSADIEIEIPFPGDVVLTIHDQRGNEVARPVAEWLPAGTRRIRLDVESLPSGVYTYQLRAGLLVESRRMVIER